MNSRLRGRLGPFSRRRGIDSSHRTGLTRSGARCPPPLFPAPGKWLVARHSDKARPSLLTGQSSCDSVRQPARRRVRMPQDGPGTARRPGACLAAAEGQGGAVPAGQDRPSGQAAGPPREPSAGPCDQRQDGGADVGWQVGPDGKEGERRMGRWRRCRVPPPPRAAVFFYNRLQPPTEVCGGNWRGEKRKNPGKSGIFYLLDAVRGLCPRPLDDGGGATEIIV
jgi:hypothetical protein